jgi:putative membrane protein
MRMKSMLTLTAALMFPAASVFAATDFNDAEIAGIVVAANEVDIAAGRIAKDKSQNEEVKAYAHRMIGEHTDVNEAAQKLVTKLGVKPESSTVSAALRTEGAANTVKFKALKGAAFDRSYIDEEIELHEKVIDVVDKKLIPSAKNEELKALLVKVRPSLVSHLEHAKKIQGMLGDKR